MTTTPLDERFVLSEHEQSLLPTDDEIKAYAEHGWHLTGKIFTDEEIDELTAAVDRYYAGERSRALPVRPPKLASAAAARLAQAEEIRVFQSTLIYKPPIAGEPSNVVPWHFDRHYWASCTSERMLTAFIPFHDCDEEMGTITMVDGSHLWEEIGREDSMVRHFAERDKSDLERVLADNAAYNGAEVRKIPMIIPRGHMSFHHCRTYHGSGPNLSSRPRQAISFHLQDGDNEYQRYELSDGSVAAYNHDVVVRRTADGRPDYADPDLCPVLWRDESRPASPAS